MVVLGFGSYIGFLGLGFLVVVWGLWCRAFLGLGSLYKHKRITLGKKWCDIALYGRPISVCQMSGTGLIPRCTHHTRQSRDVQSLTGF